MLDILNFEHTAKDFLKHFQIRRTEPNLHTLHLIMQAFCQIPYENITKILKKTKKGISKSEWLSLPDELFYQFKEQGTGGTCFSLVYFLSQILKTLGFTQYPAMAHRSYGINTHCVLITLINHRSYLLDPGFLIHKPIAFGLGDSHYFSTDFNQLSIESNPLKKTYNVYTINSNQKKLRYYFANKPVGWDMFYYYWLNSFNGSGMNSIVITKVVQGHQIYLHDKHLRIISPKGVHKKTLQWTDIKDVVKELGMHENLIKQGFRVGFM